MSAVAVLDHAAVLVFALTGALTASRAQLDIVGFVFLAALTSVGGGTLRDLLLDQPIFWVAAPSYLGLALVAALAVFFTAHLLESRLSALYWLDAAALAAAVAAGAGVGIVTGQSWPIVLVTGVATGTFGGLMRDVVANEVPLVLQAGRALRHRRPDRRGDGVPPPPRDAPRRRARRRGAGHLRPARRIARARLAAAGLQAAPAEGSLIAARIGEVG